MVDITSMSSAVIPGVNPEFLFKWYSEIIENEGFIIGDISVVVCTEDEILSVNQEYLSHDYYTDIITFDYSEDNYISGDLFISVDTVKSNAIEFSSSYDKEIFRVLAHGVLHLCGYGDKTNEEESIMRKKEEECISRVMFHVEHLNDWIPSL